MLNVCITLFLDVRLTVYILEWYVSLLKVLLQMAHNYNIIFV